MIVSVKKSWVELLRAAFEKETSKKSEIERSKTY